MIEILWHQPTNYFRVLADGQSAAFIINALNRKDQTSFFKYESSWKFWKQKSNVGNQFPNRLTFREERKLKEEEKRKREEKTDDAVPTVLGQVGHSCCEKVWTVVCQNHFEMLGNESFYLKVPIFFYVNVVCYSCQKVPLRAAPSKKRLPDGGKRNLCHPGKSKILKVLNVIIISP